MDEDLEEMRGLRVRSSGGRKNQRDADSDDDDDSLRQAATSARIAAAGTTAPERSVASTSRPDKTSSAGADEAEAMARVMGFAGFSSGNSRKARNFDIEAMVQTAREQAIRQESDDDEEVQSTPSRPAYQKFPLPPKAPAGPTLPPATSSEAGVGEPKDSGLPSAEEENDTSTDEDDDDEGEANDDTKDEWKVPCAYDLTFDHGDKAVTALTLDPAGARFITGSTDFEVKLWDFGGMQANLNPFRTCRPCEAHTINNLSFSNGGEQILVCSGNAQPKIIDREGYNVLECPKGFQYIKDMVATKGHISTVNGGCFSPKVKTEFMSCSDDGSVRIWAMEEAKEKHKYCIKMKAANGLPTRPTTCTYSKDGKFIAAGCQDGSIQVYDLAKISFVAPAKLIRAAHQTVGKNEHCVSSVCFSYDGKMICSRGLDGALRLWDLATPKKVVFETTGLPCLYPQTDCQFSPNDKLIITGTSVRKDAGQSKLVIFDRATWQLIKELPVDTESIIRIGWHPKLNQIFASTAEGHVKVFFDPNMSHNGALLCRTSKKRRAKLTDAVTADYIITPFALPMFKEEKQRSKQAQFERARKDPVKSRKPELPMTGPGAGGRVGQAGGTISSYLVRKLGYAQKLPDEDINPRDALLRHAEAAKNDPYWVSPAYSKTQPKTIFQTPEQIVEIEAAERARKRPKMEGP